MKDKVYNASKTVPQATHVNVQTGGLGSSQNSPVQKTPFSNVCNVIELRAMIKGYTSLSWLEMIDYMSPAIDVNNRNAASSRGLQHSKEKRSGCLSLLE